ncbi:MAG: endonuclease/exonuclease/phosphatase family protein [Gemmataceae bacterium]|nr:endonuclease/exonuclease/phosphatase family protein [Gemmataceae bacterium]
MLTFLFWNLNKKPLQARLASLVQRHKVDLVLLAECMVPPSIMLETLNQGDGAPFFNNPNLECQKVMVYSQFVSDFLQPVVESRRFTIRSINLPNRPEFLLAVVHFPSKRNFSGDSQSLECTSLASAVREAEAQVGHARTVLVGDLNMNPFEPGLVGAGGLNAVMARRIARRQSRTVQARTYPFFYNPMWGRFGDVTQGPPGTHYYDRGEHVTYFWNMFDQVLVRPDLLPLFRRRDLKILTRDENGSLLSKRRVPDKKNASDHLPILFRLNV